LKHGWTDSEEMARRNDPDLIASLNMINEGGVAFEKTSDDNQNDHTNFSSTKNSSI